MSQQQPPEIGFRLTKLELLSSAIQPEALPQEAQDGDDISIRFNLNTQFHLQEEKSQVVVEIKAEAVEEKSGAVLGHIRTATAFHLEGEVLFSDLSLYRDLVIAFISIAISTTRGMMHGQFRGTFLHSAILPIFDPQKIADELLAKVKG